jgi:ferredoxin
MPKVEINGASFDAFVEESLLAVARKNKAHIGYACGGNGLCQTCECVVHDGKDALTDMTDVEKAWLTHQKIQDGHRLACQARIGKDTSIKIVTRAENARIAFNRAFKEQPKEPSKHPQGYTGEFFTWFGMETLAHLAAVPFVSVNAIQRVLDGKLTFQVINDTINASNERFPEINQLVGDVVEKLPKVAADLTKDLGKNLEPIMNSTGDLLRNITDAIGKTDFNKTLSPMFESIGDAVKNVVDTTVKATDNVVKSLPASGSGSSTTPPVLKVEIKK